jgi:hypothetical protein
MKWKMCACILLIFVGAPCLGSSAQEAAHSGRIVNSGAGSRLKDPISKCAVWESDLSVDNLISWSGDCRDDKANGTGVLSCAIERRSASGNRQELDLEREKRARI